MQILVDTLIDFSKNRYAYSDAGTYISTTIHRSMNYFFDLRRHIVIHDLSGV